MSPFLLSSPPPPNFKPSVVGVVVTKAPSAFAEKMSNTVLAALLKALCIVLKRPFYCGAHRIYDSIKFWK